MKTTIELDLNLDDVGAPEPYVSTEHVRKRNYPKPLNLSQKMIARAVYAAALREGRVLHKGLTYKQIGVRLGVSRSRAAQLIPLGQRLVALFCYECSLEEANSLLKSNERRLK